GNAERFIRVVMEEKLAYETLSEALAEAGVVPTLAELHGGLCGIMCVGGVAAADRWLEQQLEEWQQDGETPIGEALHAVEHETWRMLNDGEMTFEPLLPGDEQPLDAQVRALADRKSVVEGKREQSGGRRRV